MCGKEGVAMCLGTLLIIIHILYLLLGIALVALFGFVKFGFSFVIEQPLKAALRYALDEFGLAQTANSDELMKSIQALIDPYSFILLAVGLVIVVISVWGLITSCDATKLFVTIYLILMGCALIALIVGLILFISTENDRKLAIKNQLFAKMKENFVELWQLNISMNAFALAFHGINHHWKCMLNL